MVRMDYSGALRRSWWLLVALGVVGLVVGVLLPVSHPSSPSTLAWQARTVVGTAPTGGGNQVAGDITPAQIQFYGASLVVKKATARAAGLDVPVGRYPSYLSATVVPGGQGASTAGGGGAGTVVLTARGRTRAQATALATDYANQLGDYLTFLATTSAIAKAGAGGTIVAGHTGFQVLQPATATSVAGTGSGSAGTRWVRGIIGLLIGLVLAVIVALVRERLDRGLRNAARARGAFGLPIVVEIPAVTPQTPTGPGQYPMVDVVRNPDSPGAEAYRMLRMSLLFEPVPPATGADDSGAAGADEAVAGGDAGGDTGEQAERGRPAATVTNGSGPGGDAPAGPAREAPADRAAVTAASAAPAAPGQRQIILVASPGNELTRPHVAANLAAICGEAGQKVVVISTWDIEAGATASDSPALPGSDRIRPRDVEDHLEPSRLDHVYRLSLRPFVAGSAQLVPGGGRLLDAARSVCDVVIVDVPPMLALHHAEALSHSVDVVLVVGECGYTTVDEARRAGDLLRRIGAPVLGVVLTNVPLSAGDIRQTVPRHHPAAPEPATATATAEVDQGDEGDEKPVAVSAGAGGGTASESAPSDPEPGPSDPS
jgi:Mrp family chromosome partitioning ATPase